jgi:2-polyprenyl-3-methyl-5-hydroxy-6-metoxy-1,4-benzoquinol methylase
MHTLTNGPPADPAPMTDPCDIHVILPGAGHDASPRRAMRAALATAASTIVVVAPGDDPAAATGLARHLDAETDVAFASHGGRLGPGRGSFAIRRDALARLDITEGWPVVGYEIAAQVAAGGGRVMALDGADAGPVPRRAPVVKARWSRPVVWRRERLARRRAPEAWDASDTELASTLDNLDAATNYADWIVALMAPYLRGRILEVGAGHGTFTSLLARYGPVTATELSERAVAVLRERYAGSDRITVRHVDELTDAAFDTAVMVNVLEHIDDDVGALHSLRSDLSPGGNIVIYSPAFNALYSRFDAAVGHYRRYTKATLARAIDDAGLEAVDIRYVNAAGALAWYVVATRLGRRPTEGWSTQLFDRVAVPVVRRVEHRVAPPFGQSLLAVARRPGQRSVTSS